MWVNLGFDIFSEEKRYLFFGRKRQSLIYEREENEKNKIYRFYKYRVPFPIGLNINLSQEEKHLRH